MRAGLLGEHLQHSFSPRVHAMLGDYSYPLFEVKPDALDDFLKSDRFDALNVTIPYKRAVIPYCSELTDDARSIGSVNTILRRKDGTLLGDNTDAAGFLGMLNRLGKDFRGKKALVLGSGGASRAVQVVLRKAGCETVVISRSGADNYKNLHLHSDARLLINATPVGMYPSCGISPVDLGLFPQLEGVLDLIYNPMRTQLLMDAEARGIPCMNGLFMLVEQACKASERFTGRRIDPSYTGRITQTLAAETSNIVLIGMPGCGKTTIGRLLAAQTGRRFVDSDLEIEARAGISVPEFIHQNGEAVFREVESQVLSALGKESSCVIATGGGCVTRRENYRPLHQNGLIFFLQREIAALPVEGRPLSHAGSLSAMYEARLPLYRAFADAEICNDASSETAAGRIWEVVHEILNR